MLRKFLLIVGVAILFLPLGCTSPRPYPWSWSHNKRRINTMADGFVQAGDDFNRLILQDAETFPDHLLQASLDFDRIVFDMDERALEDL
jgi:hypothetical protein